MPAWVIEKLAKHHDRSSFDCGRRELNEFLRRLAGQYSRRNQGQTYVAVAEGERIVRGYYTISASAVQFQDLPDAQRKGLPRSPVPVALLGRLAVDRLAQGHGLGARLLVDALRRIATYSEGLGIHAIEVVAIDDSARSFYLKYGFTSLIDDRRHLFLPIKTVRTALGGGS
jgi:GNAT superfamily N-acetyltransferase